MKPVSPFARLMAQATALTRRGGLVEATQAIQRALRFGASARPVPAATEPEGDVIVLEGLVREVETPTVRRETHPEAPPAAPPETRPEVRPEAPPVYTPPQPASFDELPFATPHGLRHYKLFVPAGLGDQPAPLVVMLHGCKQNPDDFAAGTGMNVVAQEQGFRVLYPAQPPRSNSHKCWNWFRPGDQKRGGGEPALLANITRHVMQTHAVDGNRVYIAGLSAGGAMTAIMAQEYPDLFAAAGVHSGLPHGAAHDIPSAFAAMKNGPREPSLRSRSVPMIVFHGDQDLTVHPRNGEHLVAGHELYEISHGAAADGGRRFMRTIYRDEDGRLVAEHWLVHGSGHAWSGGNPVGSYTDAQGPDASREMLRFFEQHRRKA
jgi:poly(hydroxyalkanoate) depolymerase family esterase